MEERNEVDHVAEKSRLLVRNKRITVNRDSSFSLRGLLNGQLMGVSIKDSSPSYLAHDAGTQAVQLNTDAMLRLGWAG